MSVLKNKYIIIICAFAILVSGLHANSAMNERDATIPLVFFLGFYFLQGLLSGFIYMFYRGLPEINKIYSTLLDVFVICMLALTVVWLFWLHLYKSASLIDFFMISFVGLNSIFISSILVYCGVLLFRRTVN